MHRKNEVNETVLVFYEIKEHLNFEMSRLGCHGLISLFCASIQVKSFPRLSFRFFSCLLRDYIFVCPFIGWLVENSPLIDIILWSSRFISFISRDADNTPIMPMKKKNNIFEVTRLRAIRSKK